MFEPTFEYERPPYGLGQPLWRRDSSDQTAYIVRCSWRSLFGDWHVDVVPENDLTGPLYSEKVDFFTPDPPQIQRLHPNQPGYIVFTSNNRPLKVVPGGRR